MSFRRFQRSLGLFAEAVAGHSVALELAEEGAACWPDEPTSPVASSVVVADEQERRRTRISVLHQVVALDKPELVWPSGISASRLHADLFAIVEDARVECEVRRRFPGAVGDVDAVVVPARERALQQVQHPMALLEAVSLLARGVDAAEVVRRRPQIARELVDAVDHEMARVRRIDATSQTSLDVAVGLSAIAEGGSEMSALLEVDDEITEDLGLEGDEPMGASLDASGTPDEVEVSDDAVGGQAAVDPPESLAETLRRKREEGVETPLGLMLPTTRTEAGGTIRSFVYDEWDFRAGAHRRAWCRVLEEELVGDDHGFIGDVRSRHRALRSRIRRSFGQVRPSDLERVYRVDDGEEVDLDAAIEALGDRRGGAPSDDRVHIRRDRARRDVATAFLVDLSASTSSPAVPPEPVYHEIDPEEDILSYAPIWGASPPEEPKRRVIDVAKDAVALMGDALHELGDRYAIYGFSGTGRENVEFNIAKDFGDRTSAATWAAIDAMKPRHYTRMGPAIRHTTSKLVAQSARTKLLVVVSDGYPQDVDYGEDRRDRDYGVHDTARALSDATALGIDTFCVTIDPSGHDYLRVMCPDHRYLVIEDVESLPEELAKVYLALSHR